MDSKSYEGNAQKEKDSFTEPALTLTANIDSQEQHLDEVASSLSGVVSDGKLIDMEARSLKSGVDISHEEPSSPITSHEFTTSTAESDQKPPTHLLVEWGSMQPLLQPIQSSSRIKYTAVSMSEEYYALGASTGAIYIFLRQGLKYVHTLPTEKEGSVVQCSLHPTGNIVGYATKKGSVVVMEFTMTSQGARHSRLRTTSDHHGANVNVLHWNTHLNKLFVGDQGGIVTAINVSASKTKDLLSLPSEVVMRLESPVVQIDTNADIILVSTHSRTYTGNATRHKFGPVGKKPRDGAYGACFAVIPDKTVPVVYCARPGSRLWVADSAGAVLTTHQFKPLLDMLPSKVIKPSNGLLLAVATRGVYILNPSKVGVVLWTAIPQGVSQVTQVGDTFLLLRSDASLMQLTLSAVHQLIQDLHRTTHPAVCGHLLLAYPHLITRSYSWKGIPVTIATQILDSLIAAGHMTLGRKLQTVLRDMDTNLSVNGKTNGPVDIVQMDSGIYTIKKRLLSDDSEDDFYLPKNPWISATPNAQNSDAVSVSSEEAVSSDASKSTPQKIKDHAKNTIFNITDKLASALMRGTKEVASETASVSSPPATGISDKPSDPSISPDPTTSDMQSPTPSTGSSDSLPGSRRSSLTDSLASCSDVGSSGQDMDGDLLYAKTNGVSQGKKQKAKFVDLANGNSGIKSKRRRPRKLHNGDTVHAMPESTSIITPGTQIPDSVCPNHQQQDGSKEFLPDLTPRASTGIACNPAAVTNGVPRFLSPSSASVTEFTNTTHRIWEIIKGSKNTVGNHSHLREWASMLNQTLCLYHVQHNTDVSYTQTLPGRLGKERVHLSADVCHVSDPFTSPSRTHSQVTELAMLCLEYGIYGNQICHREEALVTDSGDEDDNMRIEGDVVTWCCQVGDKNYKLTFVHEDGSVAKSLAAGQFIGAHFHCLHPDRLLMVMWVTRDADHRWKIWQKVMVCLGQKYASLATPGLHRLDQSIAAFHLDLVLSLTQPEQLHVTHKYMTSHIEQTLCVCAQLGTQVLPPVHVVYLLKHFQPVTRGHHFLRYFLHYYTAHSYLPRQQVVRSFTADVEVAVLLLSSLLEDCGAEGLHCSCGYPRCGAHCVQFMWSAMLMLVLEHWSHDWRRAAALCLRHGFWRGYIWLHRKHVYDLSPAQQRHLLAVIVQLDDLSLLAHTNRCGYAPRDLHEWDSTFILFKKLVAENESEIQREVHTTESKIKHLPHCLHCGQTIIPCEPPANVDLADKHKSLNAGASNSLMSPTPIPMEVLEKCVGEGTAQPTRVSLSWEGLARCAVDAVGSAALVKLLRNIGVPDGMLSLSFYQYCSERRIQETQDSLDDHRRLQRWDATLWTTKPEPISTQVLELAADQVLTNTGSLTGTDLQKLIITRTGKKHLAVSVDIFSCCLRCRLPLIEGAANGDVLFFKCGHGYHKRCCTSSTCDGCVSC